MLEQRIKEVKDSLPEPFKSLITEYLEQDFIKSFNSNRQRSFVTGCEVFSEIVKKHKFKYPCQELYDIFCRVKFWGVYGAHFLIRFLDLKCHTYAINIKTGLPFNNLLVTPTDSELLVFFDKSRFPLEKCPLEFLIGKALLDLREHHESESTIGQFASIYQLFYHYSLSNNSSYYNCELARSFVASFESRLSKGEIKYWKVKLVRRCFAGLNGIVKTGKFNFAYKCKIKFDHEKDLVEVRNKLMSIWKNKNFAKSTIDTLDYGYRKLVEITSVKTISQLYELSSFNLQKSVLKLKVCATTKASFNAIVGYIDIVLTELFKQGYTRCNLNGCILKAKVIKDYVSPYISASDQVKILKYFTSDSMHHREKAIILLAMLLGLRESDILNLKFENLDYLKQQIHLIQQKTKVPITLPFLPQVREEIELYVQLERPKFVDIQNIFINTRPPYERATDTYASISGLLKKLQITSINKIVYGPHLLRHTFVKNLLDAENPHQVITDSLGHISSKSDRYYISLEEEKLRECALGLDLIGTPLWEEE